MNAISVTLAHTIHTVSSQSNKRRTLRVEPNPNWGIGVQTSAVRSVATKISQEEGTGPYVTPNTVKNYCSTVPQQPAACTPLSCISTFLNALPLCTTADLG